MLSPLSSNYSGNGTGVHIELLCQETVAIASGAKGSDRDDGLIGELSIEVRHDTGIHSVGMVSDASYPFEVSDGIVRLVQVNVIDLWKVVRIWDESQRNEPMNGYVFEFCGIPQVDARVSSGIWFSGHVSAREISGPFYVDAVSGHFLPDSVEASDLPEIADFVQVTEVSKSYGAPFFGNRVHMSNFLPWMLDSLSTARPAVQLN